MDSIREKEGRTLFGLQPEHYACARPDYPESIYSSLLEHNLLAPGYSVLEIGAGSGLATKRLLELGADPLTAVEPDCRFAEQLASLAASHAPKLRIIQGIVFTGLLVQVNRVKVEQALVPLNRSMNGLNREDRDNSGHVVP